MTPKAQRIALAKVEGWSIVCSHAMVGYATLEMWDKRLAEAGLDNVVCVPYEPLPLYQSLDDLARVEKLLNEYQQSIYVDWFWHNLEPEEYQGENEETGDSIMTVGVWQILTATAEQRRRGLLSIFNLWTE